MKEWLVSIAAASVLSAMALALCPPGRVRSILRLVCGIVCALAVASPALRLDPGRLSRAMAAYAGQAQKIAEDAEEEQKMLERTYIEERYEAYISDMAARLGAAVGAISVEARWDDEALVWYPWEVRLSGERHDALARGIEAELGIPPERQKWGSQ